MERKYNFFILRHCVCDYLFMIVKQMEILKTVLCQKDAAW